MGHCKWGTVLYYIYSSIIARPPSGLAGGPSALSPIAVESNQIYRPKQRKETQLHFIPSQVSSYPPFLLQQSDIGNSRMMSDKNVEIARPPPSSCPVDPAARSAWLEAAAKNPRNGDTAPRSHHSSKSSARITKTRPLATDREISSIPRALSSSSFAGPSPEGSSHPPSPPPPTTTSSLSSNQHSPPSSSISSSENNTESGEITQNWIYPSEKQFYAALVRKNHSPNPTTVSSIVPIHNAVNERCWSTILRDWELRSPHARVANSPCGGPRLRSFSGDSSKLTPRARMYTWLGYERPFDRHDWVVERCGGESVEYVIDFYKGRGGGGLSFFLDVRPKLNSWAGWRLRLGKVFGL